MKFKKTFQTGG